MTRSAGNVLGKFLVALLGSTFLGACASSGAASGSAKAETTLRTAERLTGQLTELGTRLEATQATLAELRGSVGAKGLFNREKEAKTDLPTVFGAYRKALGGLHSTAKQAASSNTGLGANVKAYLEVWEQNVAQIQNAKLREASLQRRAGLQERFDKFSGDFGNLWKSFESHLQHLDEIEIAVGTDLTPAGISAIDGPLGDAQKEGESVRKGMARGAELLNAFADVLRNAAPPPPPAKE